MCWLKNVLESEKWKAVHVIEILLLLSPELSIWSNHVSTISYNNVGPQGVYFLLVYSQRTRKNVKEKAEYEVSWGQPPPKSIHSFKAGTYSSLWNRKKHVWMIWWSLCMIQAVVKLGNNSRTRIYCLMPFQTFFFPLLCLGWTLTL